MDQNSNKSLSLIVCSLILLSQVRTSTDQTTILLPYFKIMKFAFAIYSNGSKQKTFPPKVSCIFSGSIRWNRWGVFAKAKIRGVKNQRTRQNTGNQWEKKGIVSNENFIGFLDDTLTFLHFCLKSFKMKTVSKSFRMKV